MKLIKNLKKANATSTEISNLIESITLLFATLLFNVQIIVLDVIGQKVTSKKHVHPICILINTL